ncbi:cyclase family protein [Paraglaciecola polaris]|uniref:Cyclase family protein n=1 Tax=Paraglaciecola polaris LMG 21857 TaxID=1129793 RepID=K6ZD80_9ALTE|nr:cyclase family protein [Paraglaciecola polaris]GAC34061.1 cyclase family protein [Paraglaciecola polaris LMG 21857]
MPNKPHHNSKFIDLSHRIYDGLITYKGLPAPIMCDYLSREESKKIYGENYQVQIGKIEMVSNTGTYIDTPFHFAADGDDLAQVSLALLADLPVLVIDAKDSIEVGVHFFKDLEVSGKAVLINTNWSKHWNSEQYFENHAFLTAQAAQLLLDKGVRLVGIDSHNIDDTRGAERPVHSLLLGNNVLICEHLTNLEKVPSTGGRFYAVPPKINGVGTFPVRAFVQIKTD